jgi:hypothetical protein
MSDKVDYSIHDCCMSGFAMMFFQDTSMLEFQKRMQEKIQFNNLSSMFGVSAIPQDSQLSTSFHKFTNVLCD